MNAEDTKIVRLLVDFLRGQQRRHELNAEDAKRRADLLEQELTADAPPPPPDGADDELARQRAKRTLRRYGIAARSVRGGKS